MKLLAAALLCLLSASVIAQKEYVPDSYIDISGEPGDFTISNYFTKKVFVKHLKIDDIVTGAYHGLIGFRQGNKYGFINIYGKVMHPAEFDAFEPGQESYPFINRGNFMAVRKGELTALVDSLGAFALPLGNYDFMWDSGRGTCAASRDGLFGLFRNGKSITPIEYELDYNDFEFTHETMPVTKGELFGLINTSGKLVLPLEYANITELNDSNWIITKNELNGVADFNGKMIVSCSLGMINKVSDGLVYASKNDRFGIQKTDGTIVCPFEYEFLTSDPVDGKIFAQKDGFWGIMSLKTPEATSFIYSNYSIPQWNKAHIASLRKDGKVGLVNTKGEVVYDFVFDDTYEQLNFQNGTALISQNGLYGLISETGKLLIPCEFDQLDLYSSFPKVARKNGKYGVIDLHGKTLVPFEYESVSSFSYSSDLYEVRNNNKTGLYLAGEKLLIPVEYNSISKNRNFFQVEKDGKLGFYDESGNTALPCLFTEVMDFTPSSALVSKDGVLQQYDLVTAKPQQLAPDSTIRFETTSFVNFGKTFKQSGWEDNFAKNTEVGVWYCVNNQTNAMIGKPYIAMGPFNEKGYTAVATGYNQQAFAINSKGEELKPHYKLSQGEIFGAFILEDNQDSIVEQIRKHDLLQQVKPENYEEYIQANFTTVTAPYELYDDWGNPVSGYYLQCFNKSAYFTSETPFPAVPVYEYDFSELYSRTGPPNTNGWRWAVPIDTYLVEETIDMNTDGVVLVDEQGEVISKPNYNPIQSTAFFNIISDAQYSWEDLGSYSYIIDSIQPHFPGAASLNYEEFLHQYKDSLYIESIPFYNYSEYDGEEMTYAHSFYKTSGLQLFNMSPPNNVIYRFLIKDIHQVKGGEAMAQPDETRLFAIGSKTAYTFGYRQYFAYPVIPGDLSKEEARQFVEVLSSEIQNTDLKTDLLRFDYFSKLIESGMAVSEYADPDKGPVQKAVYNDDRFILLSYSTATGLAIENEIVLQPRYLAIGYDSKAEKFILVDTLFNVFSFDPESRKTMALKDQHFCALTRSGLAVKSEKTRLFDMYYSGAPRTDLWGPYDTGNYPDRTIKQVKRLYFLQNCTDFTLMNEYGEDSMVVQENGELEFFYIHYCDTTAVSYHSSFSFSGDLRWYELADGIIYNVNGEPAPEIRFSDYVNQSNIRINECFFPAFSINETPKGLELKSVIDSRTLALSDKEYEAVADQTPHQNGFGGIFRKGKFIPYSTMVPFPEKHRVYIHLDREFWLVGDEKVLELVMLDRTGTSSVVKRYPEKFHSVEDFYEKRSAYPTDGSEVNSIELFLMSE